MGGWFVFFYFYLFIIVLNNAYIEQITERTDVNGMIVDMDHIYIHYLIVKAFCSIFKIVIIRARPSP